MRITSAAVVVLLFAALPGRASQLQLLDTNAGGGGSATPAPGVLPAVPQISADGRYAVYSSQSSTLVPGQIDPTATQDVFLFDRSTGTTTLVSHNAVSPVTAGNRKSSSPVISRDGRWIVFLSDAGDLIPGQRATPASAAFLYDRVAGTTTLLSPDHVSGGIPSLGAAMNDDGRFVVLVVQLGGPSNMVVLYDRQADALSLVSHIAGSPNPALAAAQGAVMSGDGNSVVYYSAATNLVAGQTDTNGGLDVFLWDRLTGTTTLVSHAVGSPTQAGDSATYPWPLQISFDGQWVAYASAASDLTTAAESNTEDVFLWDRATGVNTLVSRAALSSNQTGNGISVFPHLTPDGRWLAFSSTASDLVAGVTDKNNDYDAFLYDRDTATVTLLTAKSGAPGRTAGGFSGVYGLSDDGLAFSLQSTATDLAPGITDTNGGYNFFLLDRGTGKIELASHTAASVTTAANSSVSNMTALSADGRVLVFGSTASDMVAADLNDDVDEFAYVRDLQDYFTLTPCRLFDSRQSGPALASGLSRKITARGACGIPATAQALTVNVTVTGPTGDGYLTAYAGAAVLPEASTLNFSAGGTRTNNGVVLLNADGTLALYSSVNGPGTVQAIVDVTGYFQ